MGLDDVELPGQRAGSLHREANAVGRASVRRAQRGADDKDGKERNMHDPVHAGTMPQALPNANGQSAAVSSTASAG